VPATKKKAQVRKRQQPPPIPELPLRDDQYYTYEQAGGFAQASARQVERWVREQGLRPTRLPQGTRIRGIDLRLWLEERVQR
jgi:hypothetical protein